MLHSASRPESSSLSSCGRVSGLVRVSTTSSNTSSNRRDHSVCTFTPSSPCLHSPSFQPIDSIGHGYGFPSSHSQYMGYFASFLVCHMYFTHRFPSTGNSLLDRLFRALVYLFISTWALAVAYSRYIYPPYHSPCPHVHFRLHLNYHSPHQVFWGFSIGVAFGSSLYVVSQVIPRAFPNSLLGRLKLFLLTNPLSQWLQIRDGWAVWPDGGRDVEWHRWRDEWHKRPQGAQLASPSKRD
jgi:dolichyldiphosphatase